MPGARFVHRPCGAALVVTTVGVISFEVELATDEEDRKPRPPEMNEGSRP